jgi:ABC-type transport system involved in multi-copper enzyme maturation permease subunit
MREVWMLVWFEVRRFAGRQRWMLWVVAALPVAALASILYAVYQITRPGDEGGSPADLGNVLFYGDLYASLLITAVGVPILAAGTFAGEREMGTLEALFLTRLASWQIIAAKLLLALAPTFIGLFILLPAVPAALLLHGVKGPEALLGLAELLVVAVLLAAVGFCCSMLTRRTVIAATAAYLLTALLLGWPLLLLNGIDLVDSYARLSVDEGITNGFALFFVVLYCAALIWSPLAGLLPARRSVPFLWIAVALLVGCCLVLISQPYLFTLDALRLGLAAAGTPLVALPALDAISYQRLSQEESLLIALLNVLGELALIAALFRFTLQRVQALRQEVVITREPHRTA